MKMYLIGALWYSADQGDYPNNFEFPRYCTTDIETAERQYAELAKDDHEWSFGFCEAYLIESGETGFKVIHGSDAIKRMLPKNKN